MKATAFAERVAGYATLTVVSMTIDYVIWPAAMLCQGPVLGGITMFFVALLANLIMIWSYDKIKKDVFAFEALRELTVQEHRGFWSGLLVKVIGAGRIPAFIAISLYDPFLSAIYMRKGVGTYMMEMRDWKYFGLAMFIGCAGGTFLWQIAIIAVRAVCKL